MNPHWSSMLHTVLEREGSFQQWTSPERCHHLVIGEILVIVMVNGVTTRLRIGPSSVLVPIESQLKVLCKRHRPRIIGKRNNWCHLKNGKRSVLISSFNQD